MISEAPSSSRLCACTVTQPPKLAGPTPTPLGPKAGPAKVQVSWPQVRKEEQTAQPDCPLGRYKAISTLSLLSFSSSFIYFNQTPHPHT